MAGESSWAFLNGRFVRRHEPGIRLEDRGLTFGDGLFEVLRVLEERVLFFDEHLERMAGSANAKPVPARRTPMTIAAVTSRHLFALYSPQAAPLSRIVCRPGRPARPLGACGARTRQQEGSRAERPAAVEFAALAGSRYSPQTLTICLQ